MSVSSCGSASLQGVPDLMLHLKLFLALRLLLHPSISHQTWDPSSPAHFCLCLSFFFFPP